MPPTFCFPCRFTDINVIPYRPLPPSDALVTTTGLSSDRIRLVATGAPIPLLKFMLLEQHVRPKADLKVFMAMSGIAFEQGHPGAKVLRSVVSSLFSRLQRRRFAGDGFKKCLKRQHSRAHRRGTRPVDVGSVAGCG